MSCPNCDLATETGGPANQCKKCDKCLSCHHTVKMIKNIAYSVCESGEVWGTRIGPPKFLNPAVVHGRT
jgi:hypothetical protein